MKTTNNKFKSTYRLLSVLAKAGNKPTAIDCDKSRISLLSAKGLVSFEQEIVEEAIAQGIVLSKNDMLSITDIGKSTLKRHLCDHDPYANQHRSLNKITMDINGSLEEVVSNSSESPLARLYARRSKDGSRFFTHYEFESGNRLRRDFEKAQMQPSITANWGVGTNSSRNSRRHGDSFDLSDFAIDARDRLEKALDAVGPELAGVTLDICCFLKGFGTVEIERGWPARSAKLMLKTALASLARHYGYAPKAARSTTVTKPKVQQWGVADYRPTL